MRGPPLETCLQTIKSLEHGFSLTRRKTLPGTYEHGTAATGTKNVNRGDMMRSPYGDREPDRPPHSPDVPLEAGDEPTCLIGHPRAHSLVVESSVQYPLRRCRPIPPLLVFLVLDPKCAHCTHRVVVIPDRRVTQPRA